MSLEQTLERIAVALETIAVNTKPVGNPAPVAATQATPAAEPPKKTTKKAAPAAEAPVATTPDLADLEPPAPPTAPAVVTEEMLRDALKRHVIKFGKDATGKVITKFGAKANAPLIADIDKTKYAQCVEALEADLKKV